MKLEITKGKVQLVDNADMGIMSLNEALSYADENGLDLVEVNVSDDVSLCKIMDYSKYLYQQKKNKKNNKKAVLKEIKFGCNIAAHDLEISAKKAYNILSEGDKVKVIGIFKGRQAMFIDSQGKALMDSFMSYMPDDVIISRGSKVENGNISMILEKRVNK